ncbi:hypothetical protein C9374_007957 [Naegleria lovaniensis]|uniref:60S ribosomal protein L6 n=1 Tax=Naegleria lovaniensis TaxID=51637 RepID=A0AA88KLE5_NAELO|nr:uncharacterized protein C9374_007957 [Naegleria lovaniensis]KAG2378809.1 hypothetical protein C9374_007957 [Naegleria lovaniensis]
MSRVTRSTSQREIIQNEASNDSDESMEDEESTHESVQVTTSRSRGKSGWIEEQNEIKVKPWKRSMVKVGESISRIGYVQLTPEELKQWQEEKERKAKEHVVTPHFQQLALEKERQQQQLLQSKATTPQQQSATEGTSEVGASGSSADTKDTTTSPTSSEQTNQPQQEHTDTVSGEHATNVEDHQHQQDVHTHMEDHTFNLEGNEDEFLKKFVEKKYATKTIMPGKRVRKENPNKEKSSASLAQSVTRLSPNALFWKKGTFAYVKSADKRTKKVVKQQKIKVVRNKQKVEVADDRVANNFSLSSVRTKSTKVQKATKLRASITPGTVLILLAGKYAGKRVVFLKQLTSGLLLVTGPYQFNGVPLRRVNQRYVIATSTKVDVTGVKVPESVTDATFAKEHKPRLDETGKKSFFRAGKNGAISEENKKVFDAVDQQVAAAVSKVELLKEYLQTPFRLHNGDKPHEMKF